MIADDERFEIAASAARAFVRGQGPAIDECGDVVFVVLTDAKDLEGRTRARYVIDDLVDAFVGWGGLALSDLVSMFGAEWGQIELAAVYDVPGDRLRRAWRRGDGDVLDEARWRAPLGQATASS